MIFSPSLIMSRDHPRSRGEYLALTVTYIHAEGSSPLSRGIPGSYGYAQFEGGIIPALAGNTSSSGPTRASGQDHPRSRGEYRRGEKVEPSETGSSPLSRGIHPPARTAQTRHRIIPALAGNTSRPHRIQFHPKDHPRSRGEYYSQWKFLNPKRGSSPLSRGILWADELVPKYRGIIPALAGNTRSWRPRVRTRRDHPRSRGEYDVSGVAREIREGSSPLSRGIRSCPHTVQETEGIIPALAGNTEPCWIISSDLRDHPRSRGEYSVVPIPANKEAGSSPLSRGIRRP